MVLAGANRILAGPGWPHRYAVWVRLGWLVNNFADPHIRLTREQRRATLRAVHERHLRGRLLAFSVFVVTPPLLIALWLVAFVDTWLAARFGVSEGVVNMVLIGLIVFATWPWSAWAYGRLYTVPFRRALREGGVRVCLGCGYLLEGIEQPGTCPECGETEPENGAAQRAWTPERETEERAGTDAEQSQDC